MAKTTKADGPSLTEEEAADPEQSYAIRRAEIGYVDQPKKDEEEGETPSVGTHSSASTRKQGPSADSSKANPRKPAQTTESPLEAQETEQDSTAHSTGGDGHKTTPRQSARRKSASKSSNDEFDEFDEFN